MKLFSWGANTYSQLGHGIKSDQCILPMEIPATNLPLDLNAVVSIVGGGGHTLILDKHGQVYSSGWNSKGQLGFPIDSEILTFTKITCLEKYNIVMVSCGWDTSMAVNEDGTLLAWGSNAYGQLGLPNTKVAFSALPIEIKLPKIRSMSVGLRHTAIITIEDKLLMCGNGRKGQLGLTDKNGTPVKQTDEPIEVSGVMDVQDVACGQHHTVVLTKTGHIFAWGDNKHGQLGVDPTLYPNVMTPLEVLITIQPDILLPRCTIFCGWTHTNLVTGKGTLINWGRNTYGQLGSHQFQRPVNWKPEVLECVSGVKQLAVGSEHNIVISGNGLLCWGWNEHGNCGIGTEEDVHTPTSVVINHHIISLIGTGAGHSFALVES